MKAERESRNDGGVMLGLKNLLVEVLALARLATRQRVTLRAELVSFSC